MSLLDHLAAQVSALKRSHPSPLHIVVAYSAGIDSHVLLHALWQLKHAHISSFQLSALYIHHGLSDNADKWQQHCATVCGELEVEFDSAKVFVDVASGKGIEAQARDARYAKLVEIAPPGSVVMLAQHQDDQLETVLLQLKRGAGPKGLSGMGRCFSRAKLSGHQEKVHFFRPLLEISQEQIHRYADEHALVWQEDESNQNIDFERNFIRRDVSPLLNQRWPHFARSVSRSALLCAQQQALLDEVTQEKLHSLLNPNNTLSVELLVSLTEPWRLQVVRMWLDTQNIPSPSRAILAQLSKELLLAAQDASPVIQWQKWQFRRFENALYVIAIPEQVSPCETFIQPPEVQKLPLSLGEVALRRGQLAEVSDFSLNINDLDIGPISVVFGGFSQRFTPQDAPQSKPLKQWFKEWKIPPWERANIAIIRQGEQIIGLLINGRFVAGKSNGHKTATQKKFDSSGTLTYQK